MTLLTHTFESDCSDFILHYLQSTEGFSEYDTYNLAYNVIPLSFCVPGFAQFDGELIPFLREKCNAKITVPTVSQVNFGLEEKNSGQPL